MDVLGDDVRERVLVAYAFGVIDFAPQADGEVFQLLEVIFTDLDAEPLKCSISITPVEKFCPGTAQSARASRTS